MSDRKPNMEIKRETLETDLEFIRHLRQTGGETMKKCYQCATCSVVCELSPKEYAFPRKEMIQASWGLKDKLMSDPDIWLCHGCMDCSMQCPRSARPADLMGALRSFVYREYAVPGFMGKAMSNPKYLPWLFIFPLVLIFCLILFNNVIFHNSDMNLLAVRDAKLTVNQAESMGVVFASAKEKAEYEHLGSYMDYKEFTEKGGKLSIPEGISQSPEEYYISSFGVLKYEDFFHKLIIEAFFFTGNILVFFFLYLGMKKYWDNLSKNTMLKKQMSFLKAAWLTLWDFLAHRKFEKCPENSNRRQGHIWVFYGFLGTAIATGLVVVGELYHYKFLMLLHLPYPMNIFHWVKILGMVSGIFLFIGMIMFMLKRIKTEKREGQSTYNDWLFLWILFGVGTTGLLTVFGRLSGIPELAYAIYYIHLVLVFFLLWYMPFSKFAHMIYRFVGLTWLKMHGRENKPEVFANN